MNSQIRDCSENDASTVAHSERGGPSLAAVGDCPLAARGAAFLPRSLDLYRDSRGRLVFIDDDGCKHSGVEPVRAFPITDPDRHISLVDPHGRELVLVQDLADLPAEDRQLLVQTLIEREFLPRIERVVHVARNKEPHIWDVETDRGAVQFLLREDDIRRLGPTRAILIDMHGVRYYIADSRQLDAKSRRFLSQYL